MCEECQEHSNMMNDINLQILNSVNTKKSTHRHITIKLQMKASRKDNQRKKARYIEWLQNK